MKIVILYTEGLNAKLLYSRLLKEHGKHIHAVIEMPVIPKLKKTKKRSKKLISKILNSSPKYILFNIVIIKGYALLTKISRNSINKIAQRNNIRYMKSETIDSNLINWLKNEKIDYIINGSSNILKNSLIDTPRYGVLNFHSAPLPEYRGAANYFWMLTNKTSELYGTLHYVEEGLDTGEIIKFSKKTLLKDISSVYDLWKKIRVSGGDLFCEIISNHSLSKRLDSYKQNEKISKTRSFPKSTDLKNFKYPVIRPSDLVDIVKSAFK